VTSGINRDDAVPSIPMSDDATATPPQGVHQNTDVTPAERYLTSLADRTFLVSVDQRWLLEGAW